MRRLKVLGVATVIAGMAFEAMLSIHVSLVAFAISFAVIATAITGGFIWSRGRRER
jgi:hypothetical protein